MLLADKVGSIVLTNTQFYIQEWERQVANTDHCILW